jgi:cell division protein FtsL
MIKFFNACLVLAVLVSGFFLYSLEHSTRALERQIAQQKKTLGEEREAIKLLSAEWSSLTRPERLQTLAQQQLHLQPMAAGQTVAEADLAKAVPDAPLVKPATENADPIGAILEQMQ